MVTVNSNDEDIKSNFNHYFNNSNRITTITTITPPPTTTKTSSTTTTITSTTAAKATTITPPLPTKTALLKLKLQHRPSKLKRLNDNKWPARKNHSRWGRSN